jgi:hypothetical protein
MMTGGVMSKMVMTSVQFVALPLQSNACQSRKIFVSQRLTTFVVALCNITVVPPAPQHTSNAGGGVGDHGEPHGTVRFVQATFGGTRSGSTMTLN